MKRVSYQNFGQGNSLVDYEIFYENTCVFTGLNSNGTSTVNAAERIIKAIHAVEQRPLVFCDLQTSQGYSTFKPGEYVFNTVVIVGNQSDPDVVKWVPRHLPRKILDAFRDHIGPAPRPRKYD